MARLASRHTRGYGTAWDRLRAQAKRAYPWVCHLCGLPIDPKAKGSAGWTLDHLDPIVEHGPKIPPLSRVRPAHLRCNVQRANRDKSFRRSASRRTTRSWL